LPGNSAPNWIASRKPFAPGPTPKPPWPANELLSAEEVPDRNDRCVVSGTYLAAAGTVLYLLLFRVPSVLRLRVTTSGIIKEKAPGFPGLAIGEGV
jgi:hypothetical protein